MRRWNGWGEDTTEAPLPQITLDFLSAQLGQPQPLPQCELNNVLAKVSTSKLAAHDLFSLDAKTRIMHARGQSFPDWVALKTGTLGLLPDAVATPGSEAELEALIQLANEKEINLIPYGGGTSVVGHINAHQQERPNLTVNLSQLCKMTDLSEKNRLAEFGAGAAGPLLESQLRAHGYTLGHFPQSFEYSTLGGWVVTRSSGQQSLYYGRIENLFAGGEVLTPSGRLSIPAIPASSAGVDLREMLMGSEGRMGFLSSAKVRITPIPETENFYGVFFPDWDAGISAMKALAQSELKLSMLRLSHPTETMTNLMLAGDGSAVKWLKRYLKFRKLNDDKCLLLFGVTGSKQFCGYLTKEAKTITRQFKGTFIGRALGKKWQHSRFFAPYYRNTLWDAGFGVDTLETATLWENVTDMLNNIEKAVHDALIPFNEKAHVYTHLSHAYPQGSSVYTTYIFRLQSDPDKTLAMWQAMKHAASQAIVATKGTISHQHGVGVDHLPYLNAEKGQLGLKAMRELCAVFDSKQIMNPGKLLH